MSRFKEFSFKKIGYTPLDETILKAAAQGAFNDFIKIIFLQKGSRIQIDFKAYALEQDALFFINAGQWYQLDEEYCAGRLLYYNRDFYCVEIHDREVACDGILFHNVYEIPVVYLDAEQSALVQAILKEVDTELSGDDSHMEEMLRILLKQLIIRSTRIWKQSHAADTTESKQEIEFARRFSQLVEWHYTTRHTVAEYADLLNLTPKALHKRITKYSNATPNDIIKARIILEAKRFLVHTGLSVKEISYKLGYDDPAYFIRLFTTQTGVSPQHFRKQYQQVHQ